MKHLWLAVMAACGRSASPPEPIELPVEVGTSADPRLVLEVREATYAPSYLHVATVVTNRGEVTFTTIAELVELLDADGAVVGTLDLHPVDFGADLGWLYPGFQAGAWNATVWSASWKPPARLRVRVASAEVERGEPKPPALTEAPLRIAVPPPADTKLAIKMVWGGEGPRGSGPSAGRVVFDVQLAVTNEGTTTVRSADIEAVFEDAAGSAVDRLGLGASFSPPLRPGDRRLFGAGHGVLAHAAWHIDVGEVSLDDAPARAVAR